jgi:predicted nucleic acid-binding protein
LREIVLDASVVMKWFAPEHEVGADEARDLRNQYRRGDLLVVVPGLVFLEILNVAGRRWSWTEEALLELALALDELEFETVDADLAAVATWTSRGLTAYDAAYVALAQGRGLDLVTDDDRIVELAPAVARPLKSA